MKKQILVAALAVIGGQILFSPAAQSYDHHWNRYGGYGYGVNRVAVPYGYGVNPYYNNFNNYGGGFYNGQILRHERHEIRHWEHRHNHW
jgi:hypothetical protein